MSALELICFKGRTSICQHTKDIVKNNKTDISFFSPPDENYEKYMSVYQGRNLNMKPLSCSEGMLNHVGLSSGQQDPLSKSCDDLTSKLEARLRQQRELRREMSRELNKELPETGDIREAKEGQCWR